MKSGVIVTGTKEEGYFFIESVSFPDGTTFPIHFSNHFGNKWYQGAVRDCYSVYLDDKEVFLYHCRGLWIADDEPNPFD